MQIAPNRRLTVRPVAPTPRPATPPGPTGARAYERLVARHGDRQLLLVGVQDAYFKPMRGFRDHRAALVGELGFPAGRVASTATRFAAPFAANGDLLAVRLRDQFARAGGVPVVALGNPTTSVDLLYALLRHPDLLERGIVDMVVLIQPAFGSPLLADAPWPLSRVGMVRKNDPAATRRELEALLASFPAHLRPKLDEAVRYVRGSAPASATNPLFRLTTKHLDRLGPNDGVSLAAHQRLAGVGRDLAVRTDADHWDLVMAAPMADSPAAGRAAFMREVLGRQYR